VLFLPCLLILPALFALFIGLGLTRDDVIEDEVYNLWSSESSDYYQNVEYSSDLGVSSGLTTLLAMASHRDTDGNIMSSESLEEIRTRMEAVEGVTVEHDGNVFTWEDICARNNIGLGTVYKFPCLRLSPLDYFTEAKWFMEEDDRHTWYTNGIQKSLVFPRVARFGAMMEVTECYSQCIELIIKRNIDQRLPLKLLGDLTAMDMNHKCRVCIEKTYDKNIDHLEEFTDNLFTLIQSALKAHLQTIDNTTIYAEVGGLIEKHRKVALGVTRAKIEEYLTYYTARGLIPKLTGDPQLDSDNPFNATSIAHGGSGIDMSGDSAKVVAWLKNFDGSPLDPSGDTWAMIESDPVYSWLIAAEEPMTSRCGNDDPSKTWCTKFQRSEYVKETKHYFAVMWFDLLINSEPFLNFTDGESNPYDWTIGEGCGYDLKGTRASYTNKNATDILKAASGILYTVDEGTSVGTIDKSILIGGTKPALADVTAEKPLEIAKSLMTIYPALQPQKILDRVRNCHRPDGPLTITEEDAEVVLEKFKKEMVDEWAKGWNDPDDGTVQFTGLFDGRGVGGTASFILRDITNDNGKLTAIAIFIIALVSVVFLFNCNLVKSMTLITLAGVLLVVLSFFGAMGLAVMFGIKININIAWTLPFIIIGLGVDDMYIVLLALKKNKRYTKESFIRTMQEVVVPVSMTSFVNFFMYTVMNIMDTAVIYKTAQAAMIAVGCLWLTIAVCFPAYCYIDMIRQKNNRCDILVCVKKENDSSIEGDTRKSFLYNSVYKPAILSSFITKAIVMFVTVALFVVGVIGITKRQSGLGLKEFFPEKDQGSRWAEIREKDLAAWSVGISWGELEYTDPQVQLRMIQQFENLVDNSFIASKDTKFLWIADFNRWTTKQCDANFVKEDPSILECGQDQTFIAEDGSESSCVGEWMENTLGLRIKPKFDLEGSSNTCGELEGICLKVSQLFDEDKVTLFGSVDSRECNEALSNNTTYCPVFKGWSEEKLAFCIKKWRHFTGGGGGILLEEDSATESNTCAGEYLNDDEVKIPIKFSSSPVLYAKDLYSHDATVEMIKQTRSICDDDKEIHCWMTGVPFDYWEQYLNVDSVLLTTACISVATGFGVATLFLLFVLRSSRSDFDFGKTVLASVVGGFLISLTCILCLIPVIGLSVLANVNLTAFSNMAFVLSVGFAVEYSVHVVHRFLSAPVWITSAAERVNHTMEFLTLPLTLSFISSTIGVVCLAFTEFSFTERFFFRPLIIVMVVTYFVGAFFLPVLLTFLDVDFLKVGNVNDDDDEKDFNDDV